MTDHRDRLPDVAQPPPERPLPSARFAERRRHLVSELRRSRPRRWGRPLLLAPAVALVVGGGALAAVVLQHDAPEYASEVTCVSSAAPGAREITVDSNFADERGERPGDRTAAQMCAPYWERKVLSADGRVPELHACLRRGQVVVIPGSADVCSRLDLPAVREAGLRAQARREAALERGLDEVELGRCRRPEVLRQDLVSLLRRYADPGWTVTIDPRRPKSPPYRPHCARTVLDPSQSDTYHLVVSERPDHMFSDEAGVIIAGPAFRGDPDPTAMTPAQIKRVEREARRRDCHSRATGTEAVQNVFKCAYDKAGSEAACIPLRKLEGKIRAAMRRYLSRDWIFVIKPPRDRKRCIYNYRLDEDLRELVLDTIPRAAR